MKEHLEQLHNLGYLEVDPLSKEKCDSIISSLNSIEFTAWNDQKDKIMGLDYDKAKRNIYRCLEHKLIMDIPEVKELCSNPKILKLVEGFLGGKPIQTQANCWWSVNRIEAENQQRFHQDYTYKKLIKLYLYLTDVGMENGPYTYVPGSFKNFITPEKYHVSGRVDDEFIKENYDEIKYFTGEKGSMFFTDPRGWHKGTPVKEGHRLLIQFEWTDDTTRLGTAKMAGRILVDE